MKHNSIIETAGRARAKLPPPGTGALAGLVLAARRRRLWTFRAPEGGGIRENAGVRLGAFEPSPLQSEFSEARAVGSMCALFLAGSRRQERPRLIGFLESRG